jgi:hypothetical protein
LTTRSSFAFPIRDAAHRSHYCAVVYDLGNVGGEPVSYTVTVTIPDAGRAPGAFRRDVKRRLLTTVRRAAAA